MRSEDWVGVIFGMGFLVLVTVVLVVLLINFGTYSRARLQRREEKQLRELVEKYEQYVGDVGRRQETTSDELTTIRERLSAIETLLREIE